MIHHTSPFSIILHHIRHVYHFHLFHHVFILFILFHPFSFFFDSPIPIFSSYPFFTTFIFYLLDSGKATHAGLSGRLILQHTLKKRLAFFKRQIANLVYKLTAYVSSNLALEVPHCTSQPCHGLSKT